MRSRTERALAAALGVSLAGALFAVEADAQRANRVESPRASLPQGYTLVDEVVASARWDSLREAPCVVLLAELRGELAFSGLSFATATAEQRASAAKRLLAQCLLQGLASRVATAPPTEQEVTEALPASTERTAALAPAVLRAMVERRLRALVVLDGLPDAPALPDGVDPAAQGTHVDDPAHRRVRLRALWSAQHAWLEAWMRSLGARVQLRLWSTEQESAVER